MARSRESNTYQVDSSNEFKWSRVGNVVDEAADVALDFWRHESVCHVPHIDVFQYQVLLLPVHWYGIEGVAGKILRTNASYFLESQNSHKVCFRFDENIFPSSYLARSAEDSLAKGGFPRSFWAYDVTAVNVSTGLFLRQINLLIPRMERASARGGY